MPTPEEQVQAVPETEAKETSINDVLDAVKTLTETVADVVESLNAMRDEYKLKTRAGIFDQRGIS